MPLYDYRCDNCGVFEMLGGRDERQVECACGFTATRLPFSGVPYLKGETVATSIPEPAYRAEAEKRHLNQTWGDASKSVELLRKNSFIDEKGEKAINLKGMSDA